MFPTKSGNVSSAHLLQFNPQLYTSVFLQDPNHKIKHQQQ